MYLPRPVLRFVLALGLVAAAAGSVHAQYLDHLKCHKMKDTLKIPKTTADLPTSLQPDFAASGCVILKPKLFCAPVAKQNVQPPPTRPDIVGQGLSTDYVCYKIKCPIQPPDQVVTDQFGTHAQTKYRSDLLCVPAVKGTPTTSSTTTTTTTTATTLPHPTECCGAEQLVLSSVAGGGFKVATFPTRPLPTGATLTVNAGPGTAYPGCAHPAIVPAGGFSFPLLCDPSLNLTIQITALGCASGGTDGTGTVWDGGAACGDANVSKVADTSDGVCNPAGQPCNTSASGAAYNQLGDVDATRGGGPCSAGGVHSLLDIPVREFLWMDGDSTIDCPDEDGVYDAPEDLLVAQFDQLLTLATGRANADFVDMNGDGCSYAGAGNDHTKHCTTAPSRPCSVSSVCSPGTCVDGAIVGVPAFGPCCQVGQTMTLVGSHPTFTGYAPFFDSLWEFEIPMQVTACNAWPGPATCTLPNSCMD